MIRPLLAALILALAGCASVRGGAPAAAASVAPDWRVAVTDADRNRLRDWRSDFTRALDRARAAGHGAEIAREGRLLEPDAAIPGRLPNGRYRCRIIKLGAKGPGLLDYVGYPSFACRVDQRGGLQRFAKLSGSQRPVGMIYSGDPLRQIFLGTLVLGDETRMMRYGHDPERDMAGWVEHIEPRRWRIILPSPSFESLTDVVELVPEG